MGRSTFSGETSIVCDTPARTFRQTVVRTPLVSSACLTSIEMGRPTVRGTATLMCSDRVLRPRSSQGFA